MTTKAERIAELNREREGLVENFVKKRDELRTRIAEIEAEDE